MRMGCGGFKSLAPSSGLVVIKTFQDGVLILGQLVNTVKQLKQVGDLWVGAMGVLKWTRNEVCVCSAGLFSEMKVGSHLNPQDPASA